MLVVISVPAQDVFLDRHTSKQLPSSVCSNLL